MSTHLLSFVTDEDGSQVSIHLDKVGLDYLLGELLHLKSELEKNDCPHTHLFSEEFGGDGLSTTKLENQPSEVHQVHHVKIYGWTDEWRSRHNL